MAGTAVPLGASYDGVGTNFALFSEVAERVELCLFDDAGGSEQRLDVAEVDGYVWHCFLPGIGPGQRYGYRVHGPRHPEVGLRCNPRSCCSTRTPGRSTARSTGTPPSTATRSAATTWSATTPTAPRSCRARW